MTPEDEFLSKQRFLVISPHADDESFGCAGTMARIKDLGGEVYVIVCSVGDLQHYDGKEDIVTGSKREEELTKVMNYLKVDDFDILYRDAETHLRLDAIPRRDLIHQIEQESKLVWDLFETGCQMVHVMVMVDSTRGDADQYQYHQDRIFWSPSQDLYSKESFFRDPCAHQPVSPEFLEGPCNALPTFFVPPRFPLSAEAQLVLPSLS